MVGFACVETDVPDSRRMHEKSDSCAEFAASSGSTSPWHESCVEVSEKASAPGAGATGQGDLRLSTRRKLHDTILALIRIGPLNQHTEMFSTNRQVILQA